VKEVPHNHESACLQRACLRKQYIIRTIWSGLYAKLAAIVVFLAMVPLAINNLGSNAYGIWVASVSLFALLNGGVGKAVINRIAYASAVTKKKHGEKTCKIISSAFFSLLALALLLAIVFLLLFEFDLIPWGSLLAVEDHEIDHVEYVCAVAALFFLLNLWLGIVGKVQFGLQRGELDRFFSGTGALTGLLFMWLAIVWDYSFPLVMAAFLAGETLLLIINNIYYFGLYKRHLKPKLKHISHKELRHLYNLGTLFFIIQVSISIKNNADNLIIAHLLGSNLLAIYAANLTLCTALASLFMLTLTPIWPAYREAMACGDMAWVRVVFIKSLCWGMIGSFICAILFATMAQTIVSVWINDTFVPSRLLVLGCSIWLCLLVFDTIIMVLLNALQIIYLQIKTAISCAVCNVVLSIYFVQQIGIEGAIFGSIIAYLFCVALPYAIMIPKFLKNLEQGQKNKKNHHHMG